MTRAYLDIVHVTPLYYDRGKSVPEQHWVMNPDRRPGQVEFANAIAKAHTTAGVCRTLLGPTLLALAVTACVIAWTAPPAVAVCAPVAAVILGPVLTYFLPRARVHPAAPDVARRVHVDDHLRAATFARIKALNFEDFGCEAHRALWDAMVAHDAADELDTALHQHRRADMTVAITARARHAVLRAVANKAYRRFDNLMAHTHTAPDDTTSLQAALSRVSGIGAP